MSKQIWRRLVRVVDSFYLWGSFLLHRAHSHRILGFIFLGLMSRFLPHPPNFTAMNAIALFSVSSLGNLRISLFTVFSTILLSDFVFGFYSSMAFVYLSFGLIVLMGYGLKSKRSGIRTTFLLTASSLLFFIITNFGVWLGSSFYPQTVEGLSFCYLAAIPFLVNNLISTLLYGGILFSLNKTVVSFNGYLPKIYWNGVLENRSIEYKGMKLPIFSAWINVWREVHQKFFVIRSA